MPWLWSKVVTGVASVSRRRTRRQRKADLLARLQANGTFANSTNITDATATGRLEDRGSEDDDGSVAGELGVVIQGHFEGPVTLEMDMYPCGDCSYPLIRRIRFHQLVSDV